MRRFAPGSHGEFGGIEWRVWRGRKAPEDLRLEIRSMEFVPVPMALGFLLADFFAENEDVLFPPSKGFQGGRRYLLYLSRAVRLGWESAVALLNDEKRRKAA
jgi:hypothetical protein